MLRTGLVFFVLVIMSLGRLTRFRITSRAPCSFNFAYTIRGVFAHPRGWNTEQTRHLLQANYDIQTIQELVRHSHIKTTMIYTHTVKSATIKSPKVRLIYDVLVMKESAPLPYVSR